MKKCRNAGERQTLRNDMKSLRKELRQREEAATKGILKSAQVVLSTLTGLSELGPLRVLDESHFDMVVIDECSQVPLVSRCLVSRLSKAGSIHILMQMGFVYMYVVVMIYVCAMSRCVLSMFC